MAASSVANSTPAAFPAGSLGNASPKKLSTAELLFRAANTMGLSPSWIVPSSLFVVEANGREQYVNLSRSPLNSDIGVSLAKNKYLTRRILERHGLPNIPFAAPSSQADAADFLQAHGKIIAKPLSGSGAQDINIITDDAQLQALDITEYILEKYIAGRELRYLVLNGEVIGVHRSDFVMSVQAEQPRQQISYPHSEWDPTLAAMATQVARVLGLTFAAIDYLVDNTGRAYILEVNTTPDLKWFHAPTSGPVVDVARQFLEATFKEQ